MLCFVYHSYIPAVALYEAGLVIACLIFLPLGPYPFPAQHHLPRAAEPERNLTLYDTHMYVCKTIFFQTPYQTVDDNANLFFKEP